ncbi:hypothetical protein DM01DRAFT_1410390 [Hesseltinella vesiculosa]|uniref:Uncharacterized protein n=1 Tax=Hesseltinella vesiculosa TaxID=101127 RepID=A0A1X2G7E5_9FUNG|nr:hypothetical protein DM01DRAFT_1410390 [Hesseltinella vesiculosa]
MSFLDSVLYSFSNIFSVGPDPDDDGECCGGVGANGTCCKWTSPAPTPVLSCSQKQATQACHCSDDQPTVKVMTCGTLSSAEYQRLHILEKRSLHGYHMCTIAMDQACKDLLLSSTICLFVLGDVSEDNILDSLMGWMNEQIVQSKKSLQHLTYGMFCVDTLSNELVTIFEEKLHQLGANRVGPIGRGNWTHWWAQIKAAMDNFAPTHDHDHGDVSAGCTGGMIDVEDMHRIARQIDERKKSRAANQRAVVNRRGRAKRTIGVGIPIDKATTTTEVTLVSPTTAPVSSF